MTLSITFFDKVKYSSLDFINRQADFFGAGCVRTTDFPITYPPPASMTVNVGQGTAWINGYRVHNDSTTVSLTFNAADTTNPRIDIIEIGYTSSTDSNNNTTGSAVLQIKQGVAAPSPVEPGADPNFIKLFAVNIAANQTTVTASNVTDRRTLVPLNVDGSQITNISGVQQTYLNAIIADIFGSTSTVLSGGVATKDGTVANQLDVTACDVYFGTGQHVNFAASQNGQFVTSTISTTYYLDYNSDGTTSFTTTHSIKTGYVTICTVTTDASGNISTVVDNRPTIINMFGTSTDPVKFGGSVQLVGGVQKVKNTSTAGVFGVATTVVSQQNVQITSTSAQQIFTFTPPANGMYEMKLYLRIITAATNVTATLSYSDSGGAQTFTPAAVNNTSLSVGSHSVVGFEFEATTASAITLSITAGTANQVYATAVLVGY